jgi:hypothetical protein
MKKFILPFLIAQALSFNAFADNDKSHHDNGDNSQVEDLNESNNTPTSYLWAQGYSPRKGLVKSATVVTNPNMTLHGGSVMSTVNTTLIFWGKSWKTSTFVSDKMAGLNSLYGNFDGSTYAGTVSEYLPIPLIHKLVQQKTDFSTSASSNPNNVLSEVCKVVGSANIDPNGYYPVYTDVKRGSAGYCAYHSAGTCGGKPLQFAFFFNLDGDAGCDPQSSFALPRTDANAQKPGYVLAGSTSVKAESQGLAALASVTAHELAETITDPVAFPVTGSAFWGGWYDSLGAENGDKCAWTFGPSAVSANPGTVLLGGIPWKLQGEWSNTAQTNGTGYLSNGLTGCLSGS